MTRSEDYQLSAYDYHLPEELIAVYPSEIRDKSRLMVLNRKGEIQEHSHFFHLPSFLRPGDMLVMNETKVINARLFVYRATGARLEVLFQHKIGHKRWLALMKHASIVKVGESLYIDKKPIFRVIKVHEDGARELEWLIDEDEFSFLEKNGEAPIPPYIKKARLSEKNLLAQTQDDQTRYQTVYAKHYGAIAAPTAGLHFTPELLEQLETAGVQIAKIVLHVGYGTFAPINKEDIREHSMHSERYSLSAETAQRINEVKKSGGRVIAVGTTSGRTLESCATQDGQVLPAEGETKIFIYPGFSFKVIDGLITNFHLPQSSLLMFVSALTDRENLMHAYHEAIRQQYRFYSYGDGMLIL